MGDYIARPGAQFGSSESPQLADLDCWNLPTTSHALKRLKVNLQQLCGFSTTLTKGTTRVVSRLKASFRSWSIQRPGKKLFQPDHRNPVCPNCNGCLGRGRTGVLIGRVKTPHRCRTKRELWHGWTLARKIAAITLKIWKEGETSNAEPVKRQAV